MANHSHHQRPSRQQQPTDYLVRADYRIPAIEKYAYCLCLHVKPTTIFIAVFKLIRALLFASILLNTEFSDTEHADLGLSIDSGHKSTAAAINILARIIMASVSAVGIYAVISGRAALLMPLYAILLVDFFFSLPGFYNRESEPSFTDGVGDLRGGYPSPASNNQYTRYSIILFSTLVMVIKIYFLCVIWKCYRYLRLIELVSPIIYPTYQGGGPCPIRILGQPEPDLTDVGPGNNLAPPPYETIASSMKPPNYEEAMKVTSTCPAYNQNTGPIDQQQSVVLTSISPDQPSPLHHEQQQLQQSTQIASDSIAIPMMTNPDTPSNVTSNNIQGATDSVDCRPITTSTVQMPQDTAGLTPQHDASESAVENPPNVVVIDPNESCDKH